MYGEIPIKDTSVVRFDVAGKLTLPAYTHAEPGELLVILKTKDSYLDIYNKKIIEDLQILKKILENGCDEEHYRKVEKAIENFYSHTLHVSRVSATRQIYIPKDIKEEYSISNPTVLQGVGNHTRLFKSEGLYKEHIRSLIGVGARVKK